MALAESYTGSETVSTTEWDLISDSSSLSSLTTKAWVSGIIDLSGLAVGDVFDLRIYDKVYAGESQKLLDRIALTKYSGPLYHIIPVELFNGWTLTLKRAAGSDAPIKWSLRTVS
jgi:hypothetical protein